MNSPIPTDASPIALRSPRSWLALLFLVAAYAGFDSLQDLIYRPVAHGLGLHMIASGMMNLVPYATLMIFRLGVDAIIVAVIILILGRRFLGFPLLGPKILRNTGLGITIGLIVMGVAIVTIWLTGSAKVASTHQSVGSILSYGGGWFVFDFIGAAGEELFGRVAVLLVAERFVGRRGAILASGLVFAALHLGNPGVSWVWLLRLCLQGMLLAWAVYKTGSFWWSTGYHTGWNWASAPLFGAAGSGYLDQGHLFDFTPTGSIWITGGTVGPEGSLFAFAAMLCAFGMLMAVTSRSKGQTLPEA